jgi:hypothetical protein
MSTFRPSFKSSARSLRGQACMRRVRQLLQFAAKKGDCNCDQPPWQPELQLVQAIRIGRKRPGQVLYKPVTECAAAEKLKIKIGCVNQIALLLKYKKLMKLL